jgi:ArsR family transcriptional regulator
MSMSKAAEVLAALGSEHRLKIVELLRGGERCVCEITPEFELDPSVVSRHLAVLEQAGVIVSRRAGRWIFYRVADDRILQLAALARGMAEPGSESGRPASVRPKRGCCGRKSGSAKGG